MVFLGSIKTSCGYTKSNGKYLKQAGQGSLFTLLHISSTFVSINKTNNILAVLVFKIKMATFN
jgi:hypothetical protein